MIDIDAMGIVDHLYIISKGPNLTLNLNWESKITSVITGESVPDTPMTRGTLTYFKQLETLNSANFNSVWYISRYSDIDRNADHNTTWKHWTRIGQSQNRNPIDGRQITHEEFKFSQQLCQVLLDAVYHHYQRIMILRNDPSSPQSLPDFDRVLEQHGTVIKENKICVFTYRDKPYAYILTTPEELLLQCSYLTCNTDDLIDMLITTNNLPYQVFNHSTNFMSDDSHGQLNAKSCPLLEHTCNEIIEFRNQYLDQLFQEYINQNHLTESEILFLKHMLSLYPYDRVKEEWNTCLNLDFKSYLYLCLHLQRYTYPDHLKVRLPSSKVTDFKTIYFDRNFYLRTYPVFKGAFKSYGDAFIHYTNHGTKEKLIPNQAILCLMAQAQEYTLHRYLDPLPVTPELRVTMDGPYIYILTRTYRRPRLFQECVDSILSQQYPKIRHIVSYDDADTLVYVKKYTHPYKVVDLTQKKKKYHPNQYIDFLYEHIPQQEPGWVLVLDDDDKFMTPNAIGYLLSHLKDATSMPIWMLYRPDKYIYPRDKSTPIVGEIGSCCYIYHSSMIQKGFWKGDSIGDFSFFKHLFGHVKKHDYIDLPLTGVNYTDQVSGWTAS